MVRLPSGVPVIHFATGNPSLLPLLGEAFGKKKRPAVIGVDWLTGAVRSERP